MNVFMFSVAIKWTYCKTGIFTLCWTRTIVRRTRIKATLRLLHNYVAVKSILKYVYEALYALIDIKIIIANTMIHNKFRKHLSILSLLEVANLYVLYMFAEPPNLESPAFILAETLTFKTDGQADRLGSSDLSNDPACYVYFYKVSIPFFTIFSI